MKNPEWFSEKINWLNLYYYKDYKPAIYLGDKIGLREFIESKELEKFLVPLIGTFYDINDIQFLELPNQFVVKKSNASGMNIIVKDKSQIVESNLMSRLNKWMKTDYGSVSGEKHYSKMEPRIMIEEYLEDICREYQFFIFNGKVKSMAIINFAFNDYYEEGLITSKSIDEKINMEIKQLESFEIKELLNKLCDIDYLKEIPFFRCDLIETKSGKIYIGEFTFTPGNGLNTSMSKEQQLEWGKYLRLPLDD
ncbi:ATP-grasp fold amidoligase family protein [Vagococcus vulneris]|uniref:ATP-grasp domain-containing protein n=1 Tax=Vagococcus vulneris TaxID=1977869 RepID=A0A429ZZU5_9ENTE|nr:ATP-grasp fold amidoligase family protein [Vagococcus vulneris]RST99575.1 hypothetical protein CBF37_04405 [Vagococcus vulneris]